MDFLKILTEALEDAKENNGLSYEERGEFLAKRFGRLMDMLEPGDLLRRRMAEEALKREPEVLNHNATVNRNHEFRSADLDDYTFRFLVAEAESVGMTIIADDEMLLVKTGLSNEIFTYGTVPYPKVLSSIKDGIKLSRLYAARDSKLDEAIMRLTNTDENWQTELNKSWGSGGDDVVIYTQSAWQDYNTLCQIFTILGGRVVYHLDDYRSFRLSYIENKDCEGSTKLSWTFPYSMRSLAKFRDIVNLMLIITTCQNDDSDDNTSVEWLKERIKAYGWFVDFWEDGLSVTAGIVKLRHSGKDVIYRELRILTIPYTLSSCLPLLELLWQVELGEIHTFEVPIEGRLTVNAEKFRIERCSANASVDCEAVVDGRSVPLTNVGVGE